jgi:hypothetical protein
VAQWADRDAIVVHEAGSVDIAHSFEFDPRGGRELFFYYGAHLGSGIGTAAGVQLARPGKQVICLVGDGSFLFGPTALWNMARLDLPVTVVVYNNHAYSGPHNRALANLGGTGRSIDANKFVHDYLGKPDMDMAAIAKGFGVDGERAKTPAELKAALARARRTAADGKPYLIDVEVARHGPGWAGVDPWCRGFLARSGGSEETACARRPWSRCQVGRGGGSSMRPGRAHPLWADAWNTQPKPGDKPAPQAPPTRNLRPNEDPQEQTKPRKVDGSSATYSLVDVRDGHNVIDWFPAITR